MPPHARSGPRARGERDVVFDALGPLALEGRDSGKGGRAEIGQPAIERQPLRVYIAVHAAQFDVVRAERRGERGERVTVGDAFAEDHGAAAAAVELGALFQTPDVLRPGLGEALTGKNEFEPGLGAAQHP